MKRVDEIKTRLAKEAAKLNPKEERALAEETFQRAGSAKRAAQFKAALRAVNKRHRKTLEALADISSRPTSPKASPSNKTEDQR